MLPVETLIPYANNARTHSDAQVAQIAASIKEFRFNNPVLIDGENGIVAGHGRVLAARKLGMTEVPCIRLGHLSDAQRRAFILADNKLALNAGWDDDLLRLELGRLEDDGFAVELMGWDTDELAGIRLADEAGGAMDQGDADECPEANEREPAISQVGEVYELGPHRLMCGDSTRREHWASLLGSETGDAVLTDPPYGVNYVGKTKDALPVHNDDPEGLPALLDGALGVMLERCKPGGAWYVAAPPGPLFLHFANWMNEKEILRQMLIWNKDAMVLGHGDYHYKHEPIFYGWKPGAPHRPTPDRTQVSVWDIPRPKRSTEHPTMKPVALYEKMLLNSTVSGEIILEPFGGSGTTLMAAAKTGRVCRAMEISPHYCDVIRRRWTRFARENNVAPGSGALEDALEDA
jgi:DNA modification methylase